MCSSAQLSLFSCETWAWMRTGQACAQERTQLAQACSQLIRCPEYRCEARLDAAQVLADRVAVAVGHQAQPARFGTLWARQVHVPQAQLCLRATQRGFKGEKVTGGQVTDDMHTLLI